jgi:heme-degrading monooxygenase HmoA
MIIRSWRGYASPDRADAYVEHLLKEVQPSLSRIPGFRDLYLLRRRVREEIEYQVLTFWESMDAVGAFAGSVPERAVVRPEAAATLLRFDQTVCHYDVLAAPAG